MELRQVLQLVAGRLRIEAGDEEVLAMNPTSVRISSLEAAAEQRRHDQQEQREGHLAGHEQARGGGAALSRSRHRPRVCFHRLGEADPCGADRRQQAEQQSRQHRHGEREDEDAPIGADVHAEGLAAPPSPRRDESRCCPSLPTSSPPPPPRSARSRLSVAAAESDGHDRRRSTAARPSRDCVVTRASSRLARFAQATASTSPTIAACSGVLTRARMPEKPRAPGRSVI